MKKILVVEDSIIVAKAIKMLLEKEGMEVQHAQDGKEAIQATSEKQFDLIILDLMMPAMTGEEVLKKLKSEAHTKDTKVMILTAKTDAMKWEEEELKICDKFMTKPFNNEVLVKEVKTLID